MEGSDAFSQGLGAEDDPFAGSEQEFDAAVASDPDPAPATEPDPPLPVVDREGQPVEEPAADAATQVEPEADPFATDAPANDPPEVATPPAAEQEEAPAAEQPVEDPPEAASSAEPGEAAGNGSTPEAEAGAGEPDHALPDPPPEAAPPPEEKKGGTKRQYRLFTPDGGSKFSEVSWYEDKTGKIVAKGTHGAKKQVIVLARGQEDALAHGYSVMGSPQGGVGLVAVAATYWQVRHVEPDPVPPVRQRLKIS